MVFFSVKKFHAMQTKLRSISRRSNGSFCGWIYLCFLFKWLFCVVHVLKTEKALNMNRHISSLLIRSYSFHKHLTYGTIDFLDLYLRKKYFTRELPFPIERHTCQILKTFYCHSWYCFFFFFFIVFSCACASCNSGWVLSASNNRFK